MLSKMEIHVQSFGARLRMRGEIFVLATPDLKGGGKFAEQEIAPHQVGLILLYQGGGSISADAMALALKNQVDILLCDPYGMPLGRLWSIDPSPPLAIQAAQFRLIGTPRSMEFVKEWLGGKFRRKMTFLERLQRYREGEKAQLIQSTRQSLAESFAILQKVPTQNVPQAASTIRGLEGNAARVYLSTLSALLQPEYQFEGRSRRPASDIFNSFLNYGYGMLYRTVEKFLVEAGVNPFAGFMHGLAKRKKAMVFDVIEAYRPWVDNIVFVLCSRKVAMPKHTRPHNGGLWLSNEGKTLMIKSFHDFLRKERPNSRGTDASPLDIMKTEIKAFAALLREIGKELENFVTDSGSEAPA